MAGFAFEKDVTLTNYDDITKEFARWDIVAYGGAVIAGVYLLSAFLFLPESPKWLVSEDKINAARVILQRLRGEMVDVDVEINTQVETSATQSSEVARISDLLKPEYRQQMFVGCSLMVMQQVRALSE